MTNVKFVIEPVLNGKSTGLGTGTTVKQDSADGVVRYTWVAADFDTEGLYKGQAWITDGTKVIASELMQWEVVNTTTAPF